MWYVIGTTLIPGLIVPLMASYFEKLRIQTPYAFASMLGGWLISTLWLIADHVMHHPPQFISGIEPMYPGLFVSVSLWALGRIRVARVSG
jgi:hypothetical protein